MSTFPYQTAQPNIPMTSSQQTKQLLIKDTAQSPSHYHGRLRSTSNYMQQNKEDLREENKGNTEELLAIYTDRFQSNKEQIISKNMQEQKQLSSKQNSKGQYVEINNNNNQNYKAVQLVQNKQHEEIKNRELISNNINNQQNNGAIKKIVKAQSPTINEKLKQEGTYQSPTIKERMNQQCNNRHLINDQLIHAQKQENQQPIYSQRGQQQKKDCNRQGSSDHNNHNHHSNINNQKYYYKPNQNRSPNQNNNQKFSSSQAPDIIKNQNSELLLKDQIVKVVEKFIIPPSTNLNSNQQDKNYSSSEEIIVDNQKIKIGQRVYFRGKFLGKGGFAKCYEFVSQETKKTYAGKVIDKQTLQKLRKRQKIQSEIQLHRQLLHPHIVRFEHFFEDEENVYMLLELCENQTLADLMRRRWWLTEFEVRYYAKQLIEGLKHMHSPPFNVLHRDLKLGNLFLDHKMQLKIGDFGLATQLKSEIDLRSSICGTPNYMPPEILMAAQENQNSPEPKLCAYSLAADIWAVGVIMYTLVVGRPPFETPAVEETYKKIKSVSYSFPNEQTRNKQGQPPLSYEFMDIITLILQKDPKMRPSLDQILSHQYFQCQPIIPPELPQYCLTEPPSADFQEHFKLSLITKREPHPQSLSPIAQKTQKIPDMKKNLEFLEENLELKRLELEVMEDLIVVSRWADYSHKYGIGYRLNENSYAVLFNDGTSVIQSQEQERENLFTYIPGNMPDRYKDSTIYSALNLPKTIEKKFTLMKFFKGHILSQDKQMTPDQTPAYLELRQFQNQQLKGKAPLFVRQSMENTKCMLFIMSNDQIQAHFNDSSLIIMDKPRKIGIFFSPKQPKIPFTFSLTNTEKLAEFNSQASKRLEIIQQLLKAKTKCTPNQNYNAQKLKQPIQRNTVNNVMRPSFNNYQLQQQDKENNINEAQNFNKSAPQVNNGLIQQNQINNLKANQRQIQIDSNFNTARNTNNKQYQNKLRELSNIGNNEQTQNSQRKLGQVSQDQQKVSQEQLLIKEQNIQSRQKLVGQQQKLQSSRNLNIQDFNTDERSVSPVLQNNLPMDLSPNQNLQSSLKQYHNLKQSQNNQQNTPKALSLQNNQPLSEDQKHLTSSILSLKASFSKIAQPSNPQNDYKTEQYESNQLQVSEHHYNLLSANSKQKQKSYQVQNLHENPLQSKSASNFTSNRYNTVNHHEIIDGISSWPYQKGQINNNSKGGQQNAAYSARIAMRL